MNDSNDAENANDTADVLRSIYDFIQRYVVIDEAGLIAASLWVLHTHVFEIAEVTPYLHITSATKECGKTRLLEVLKLIVRKPWLTGSVTPAVLSRKIDAEQPTLLLDESDATFNGDKEKAEAIRGTLNTGYQIGGSRSVLVPDKERGWAERTFSTFSPKAFAGIGSIPDTVVSRSITIVLQRKLERDQTLPFRRREAGAIAAPIKLAAETWALRHLDYLRECRPEDEPGLPDRAADVWEPLFAIADLAGPTSSTRARGAAIELTSRSISDDPDIALLRDIGTVLAGLQDDRIPSFALCNELNKFEGAPWQKSRTIMTPSPLARILGPLGIHPRPIRIGEKVLRGYFEADFSDAFARYNDAFDRLSPNGRNSRYIRYSGSIAHEATLGDVADVAAVTSPKASVGDNSRADASDDIDLDDTELVGYLP